MLKPSNNIDLSIVVLSTSDAEELEYLLTQVQTTLSAVEIAYEFLVVKTRETGRIQEVIKQFGGKGFQPDSEAYGDMVKIGISQASGDYLVMMEPELAPSAKFLLALWEARSSAEVVIASRYVSGGKAKMPLWRKTLSRVVNILFSRGLDLRVRDMSSGFRLYKTQILKSLALRSNRFEILQEILVTILLDGYKVAEIPFSYSSRNTKDTFKRFLEFGIAYIRTFSRLWNIRNSIAAADYDYRAYDSLIPPQRYWQRMRYRYITEMHKGQGRCADIGCGSSRIMGALPTGSVSLDILFRKLRFARRFGHPLVQGSVLTLPIASESFPCVICSQVIEHIPREGALEELDRILEPGGLLILGTPDYSNWQWIVIEWLYKVLIPTAYADEHITHYSYDELVEKFVGDLGYRLETVRYILQGELILGLRKPSS